MFLTGDEIGPYILINQLGEGAFGVVWLAEKPASFTKTKFALKLPKRTTIDVQTIKEEAELWEKASGHKNIVPVIEGNEYEVKRNGQTVVLKQVVIVSEYVIGGSLETWLNSQGGRVSVEDATSIISEVLAGLEYLHSLGIIHRDLKPANILIQGQTPRIADFGLARALTTGSYHYTEARGSLAYMAPETLHPKPESRKISRRTDLWSVGVIFYQLLTGRLPFPHHDIAACIEAIRKRNPTPLPSSVPTSIREIVTCALNKNPKKRYRSSAEMLAAVRAAIIGYPSAHSTVSTRSIPRLKRLATYFKKLSIKPPRNLARKLIIILIFFALSSGAVLLINRLRHLESAKSINSATAPNAFIRTAAQHLNNGDKLFDEKKWSDAESEYRKAILIEPNNAQAYMKLASTLVKLRLQVLYTGGDYQKEINYLKEAESMYRKAVQLEPTVARWHAALASFLINDITIAAEDNHATYVEAEAEFQRAIQLEPNNAEFHNGIALPASYRGKYKMAETEYRKAVQLEPNNAQWHADLAGFLFQYKNNDREAESEYRKARELNPDDATLHYELGGFFWHKKKLAEAEDEFRKAIKLEPNNAEYHASLGGVLLDKNNAAEAEAEKREAIRLQPNKSAYHVQLGHLLSIQQRWGEAEAEFREVVRLNPGDWYSYERLGDILVRQGKLTEAEEIYRKVISMAPKSTRAEEKLVKLLEECA